MLCALLSTPRRVRHPLRIAVLSLIGIVGAAFGIYASTGVLGENIHTVVAGRLYRSAQLSIPTLDRVIAEHGVRSVLSLRKADPPAPEVVQEQDHLQAIRMEHENVPLSPQKLPRPEALAQILARFDQGPYPMLVHCEEGADRTGLAVVIWLVVYDQRTVADARAQELSWRTGHFSIGQAHAMDDFFDLYESTSGGVDLRTWIYDTYPHLYDSRSHSNHNVVFAHDRG